MKDVERFAEAVVAQVGGVEDDAETVISRRSSRPGAPIPPDAFVPCA
jgi:hypothetical protein